MGDEGVALGGVVKLRAGLTLYKDFFEFLPPLSYLLTQAWTGVFGLSLAAVRGFVVLTVCAIAGFTHLSCRCAGVSAPAAAAWALAWALMSQGEWTQLNHHWIATAFSAAVMWAALHSAGAARSAPGWAVAGGLAAGAAGMVTPTCGLLAALAGLAVHLSSPGARREAPRFVLATAVVPVFVLAYLAAHGALAEAWSSVIVFTASRYSAIQSLPYGAYATWQNAALAAVFPFCAAGVLLLALRDGVRALQDRVLLACAAFALAGLVGSYPRPDLVHISFGAPLALPLAALLFFRLVQPLPLGGRRIAAGVLALSVPVSSVEYGRLAGAALSAPRVRIPVGEVSLLDPHGGLQQLVPRVAALPSGDRVFFYPYSPNLAFLTGRLQVSRFDVMTPSYTEAAQYDEVCRTVLQEADWVVFDRMWASEEWLRLVFPRIADPSPPETRRLESALHRGFDLAAQFGTYDLRRRTPAAAPALCDPP